MHHNYDKRHYEVANLHATYGMMMCSTDAGMAIPVSSDECFDPMPIVRVPSYHPPQVTHHRCDHCRSLSPNDARGNCAACGAPRPDHSYGANFWAASYYEDESEDT